MAVGSATANAPRYSERCSVSASRPARVGGTENLSSIPPELRTATRCLATTAASIPTVTELGSDTIEGPPFCTSGGQPFTAGRSPDRYHREGPRARSPHRLGRIPTPPDHQPATATRPPDHVSNTMRTTPGPCRRDHQFPQPGLLGRRIPATIRTTSLKLRGFPSQPGYLPRSPYVTTTHQRAARLLIQGVLCGLGVLCVGF